MSEIKQLLSSVYNEGQLEFILSEVKGLLEKYSGQIKQVKEPISEKDICLITYGDQVYEPGERKLSILNRFIEKYLSNITTIHILPFYPYSSDDGFSVVDYYAVNDELGDWEDINQIGKSHKLMFDAVINHISQKSSWFEGYLSGDALYDDYFVAEDPSYDYSSVVRPRVSPLLHEFKDASGVVKHIWTTFSKDQVDLNYRNPKVLVHVLDVLMHYLAKGANILRLDAIGFMWKEKGTSSIHLSETHQLIKAIRVVLEQLNPEVILITETNVPHKENISYFGNGSDEAHMVYNFTLPPLLAYSLLKENTAVLHKWCVSLELPTKQVCFFNFTASHDGVGVRPLDGILPKEELITLMDSAEANGGLVSYKANKDGTESPYEINCNYYSLLKGTEVDEAAGIKRFITSQAVAMAMPGLPAIYFHSLLGSQNYRMGVQQTGHNRTINREKLRLQELEMALSNPSSLRARIFEALQQVINVRTKERAFFPYGDFEVVDFGANIFSIRRTFDGESVLTIFNFTNKEQRVDVKISCYDLFDHETKSGTVKVGPLDFLWLKEI